jgi:hypothetical protein
MARFNPSRVHFGRAPLHDEDDGEGLPKPLTTKASARRAAGIREASEVLAQLPGPGESLHAVMTARLDMTDVLAALLDKLGRCDRAVIATLGYNRRNFRALLGWLDAGKVGSLTLLASVFFRSHNGDLWSETVSEFRRRGQPAACAPSHAKVAALAFASGARLALEGSANLCSNGSAREQFVLCSDPTLHDWHAAWITDLVSRHEGQSEAAG